MREKIKWWVRSAFLARMRTRPDVLLALKQLQLNEPTVFYLGIPEHGNLGDQAIALATQEYLAHHLPDTPVFQVPDTQVHHVLPLLARKIRPQDMILIHGGGNLGDIWPELEDDRREIVQHFQANQIIQMPQSVHFNQPAEQTKSQRIYSQATNLTLVGREMMSAMKMRDDLNHNATLVPDIVMWLQPRQFEEDEPRHGVMTIFRQDVEQQYDNQLKQQINAELATRFERVTASDTVLQLQVMDAAQRQEYLTNYWHEMARHEAIVTDRLHGLIFGLITQTPTVALANNNGKITSLYDTWLTDIPWLTMWTPGDKPLQDALDDVLAAEIKPADFKQAFAPLDSLIGGF